MSVARACRKWIAPVVPPARALMVALYVVAMVIPATAAAGIVHGSEAILAVLLGVAACTAAALAMPTLRWGIVFALLTATAAAAGAAAHERPVPVAVIVALAALFQAPISIRVGAVGAMLPVLPPCSGASTVIGT